MASDTRFIRSIVAQPDGKILVGGRLARTGRMLANSEGPEKNGIVRFNIDGTLDTTFNPNTRGEVWSIVVQPDGKIVAGGGFLRAGGLTRFGIARFNYDGSLDTTFDVGAYGGISSIAIQNDCKIVICGSFKAIGEVIDIMEVDHICKGDNPGIARLNPDGSLDTTFNPDIGDNQKFASIAIQSDGKILLGSSFLNTDGEKNNCIVIVRLNSDGTTDQVFKPPKFDLVNKMYYGYISSIVVQPDGKILVVGLLKTSAGKYIARLHSDGTIDTTFGIGTAINPNQYIDIDSIVLQTDGKMLLGGSFTTIVSAKKNHIVRLNSDGTLDQAFNPGDNSHVFSIATQPDGKILTGGGCESSENIESKCLVRFNSDGTLDTTFIPWQRR